MATHEYGSIEMYRPSVAAYWLTTNADDIEAVAKRLADAYAAGEPSCVWHEVFYYCRETYPKPACSICGAASGRLGPSGAHELCRLRRVRGLPTPPLPDNDQCECAKCRDERTVARVRSGKARWAPPVPPR